MVDNRQELKVFHVTEPVAISEQSEDGAKDNSLVFESNMTASSQTNAELQTVEGSSIRLSPNDLSRIEDDNACRNRLSNTGAHHIDLHYVSFV